MRSSGALVKALIDAAGGAFGSALDRTFGRAGRRCCGDGGRRGAVVLVQGDQVAAVAAAQVFGMARSASVRS